MLNKKEKQLIRLILAGEKIAGQATTMKAIEFLYGKRGIIYATMQEEVKHDK